MERDEVLCRLPDEHCQHTTSFTEGELKKKKNKLISFFCFFGNFYLEQFQNFDPTRDESFIELSGLVSQTNQ